MSEICKYGPQKYLCVRDTELELCEELELEQQLTNISMNGNLVGQTCAV